MNDFVKWHVEERTYGQGMTIYKIMDSDGKNIVSFCDKSKADDLVREHNEYPILVEALGSAFAWIQRLHNMRCDSCDDTVGYVCKEHDESGKMLNDIYKALSTAKGNN